MDWAKAIRNDEGVDWDKALLVYESIIACESEDLRVKATNELARLSKDAPETTLVAAVPVVVDLLRSGPRLQAAATYALSRLVCRFDGRLCPMIGQLGTIPLLLGLLSQSTDGFQKTLLKCLSSLVSFDGPNRVILARNEGLEIVLNLLPNCTSDVKLYLLEVLSALAMLREVRRAIIGQGGLRFLVEAISNGRMTSRRRAAQAIGLLGIARRIRHMLVNLGAVPALVELLQQGVLSEKLVATNALEKFEGHKEISNLDKEESTSENDEEIFRSCFIVNELPKIRDVTADVSNVLDSATLNDTTNGVRTKTSQSLPFMTLTTR